MSDAPEQASRIATLERQVSQLETQLATLAAALGETRERIDLSMRGQTRCPACGCRRILHASQVLDQADGGVRAKLALVKPSVWRSRVLGQLEVYACTKCGLVEWYANDLDEIESDDKIIRIIEGRDPTSGGPYR